MAEPLIALDGVRVVYNAGKENEITALHSTTLKIYPEEYIILYGPSGCGKSTLLNTIAGLETPATGSVDVAGKTITDLSENAMVNHHRNTIGMVFQSFNLIPSLSVLENVQLPNVFLSRKKRERKKIAMSLLERFGVGEQADKRPTELSGGQQQRVAISRSLVNDPLIILADEPVGNLDSKSATTVMQLLTELNQQEKRTIILVTHDASYLRFAHRVFYMRDGKVYKEEVNHDRKQVTTQSTTTPTTRLTGFDMLLQAYPEMSPLQMNVLMTPFKAKMVSHHLLSNYEEQQFYDLQNLIEKRISGRIDDDFFLKNLDAPEEEGGIGLDKRTAVKFARIVEDILAHAKLLRAAEILQEPEQIQHIVAQTADFLIKQTGCDVQDAIQRHQIERTIENRIQDRITKEEAQKKFDLPLVQDGAGLDKRSARKVARILELLMLIKFGMMPAKHPTSLTEKKSYARL